jgi:hypothetical protein
MRQALPDLYFCRTVLDDVAHRVFLQNHRLGRFRWLAQGTGLCRVCGVYSIGPFGFPPGCAGSGPVRQAVVSVSEKAVGVWSAVSQHPLDRPSCFVRLLATQVGTRDREMATGNANIVAVMGKKDNAGACPVGHGKAVEGYGTRAWACPLMKP